MNDTTKPTDEQVDELKDAHDRQGLVALLAELDEQTPIGWDKTIIARRILTVRARRAAEAEARDAEFEDADPARGEDTEELAEPEPVEDAEPEPEPEEEPEPESAEAEEPEPEPENAYEEAAQRAFQAIENLAESLSLDDVANLKGDVKAFLVDVFKHRPTAWSQLSRAQQQDLVQAVDFAADQLIRKMTNLMAKRDLPTVMGKLKNYKDAGDKIVVTLEVVAARPEDIVALHESVNRYVQIVHSDSAEMMGEKQDIEVEDDQRGLEFADTSDADAEAEMTVTDANALYESALALLTGEDKASTSRLQRGLGISHNDAKALIDRLEREGVVGKPNELNTREILVELPRERDDDGDEPADEALTGEEE